MIMSQSLTSVATDLKKMADDRRAHQDTVDGVLDEVRDLMSDLGKQLTDMQPAIKALQSDMERVRPIADQIVKWRFVGVGVIVTLTIIGSVFGGVILRAKEKIINFLFGA